MKTLNFKTKINRLTLNFGGISLVLVLLIAAAYSLFTLQQRGLNKTLNQITFADGKYLIGSKQIDESELDSAVAQLEQEFKTNQSLLKAGEILGIILLLANGMFYTMQKKYLEQQSVILEEKNKKKNFRLKTGSFPSLTSKTPSF